MQLFASFCNSELLNYYIDLFEVTIGRGYIGCEIIMNCSFDYQLTWYHEKYYRFPKSPPIDVHDPILKIKADKIHDGHYFCYLENVRKGEFYLHGFRLRLYSM